MPKLPNIELIDEKFKNVHKRIDAADKAVTDLEATIEKEYAPLTTTKELDKRVGKFENVWDLVMKTILVALVGGVLVLLGLGAK